MPEAPDAGLYVKVEGADQAREIGLKLREAGLVGRGLRRNLLAEMRLIEKPLVDAAKDAAEESLPKSGGLNVWPTFRSRNSLSGKGAGVRIIGTHAGSNHNLRLLDLGVAKHPVYGHRDRKWAKTTVPVGWFTNALRNKEALVQLALFEAIRRTADRI